MFRGTPIVSQEIIAGLPVYTVRFSPGYARGLFTTRLGGVSRGHLAALNLGATVGDTVENVRENRARVCRAMGSELQALVTADQVHGTRTLSVDNLSSLEQGSIGNRVAGEGDALITRTRGVLLAVLVADCVPILLYDPRQRAVACVHAGWRGTVAAAPLKAIKSLVEQYGTDPADVQAVIGPSIGPCCYEVDATVIEPLYETMGGNLNGVIHPIGSDRGLCNLSEANRRLLLAGGVRSHKLNVTGLCTACDTGRFYSHRAEEGCTGRMAALISLV